MTKAEIDRVRECCQRRFAANEFALDRLQLSTRDPALVKRLAEVAQQAKQLQSRLVIVARNDNEGRWGYQQMRQAVSGYRVRGNIKLGSVPHIVLIDME